MSDHGATAAASDGLRMCTRCGRMHGPLAPRCASCGAGVLDDGRTRRVARAKPGDGPPAAAPATPPEAPPAPPETRRRPIVRTPNTSVLRRIFERGELPLPRRAASPRHP